LQINKYVGVRTLVVKVIIILVNHKLIMIKNESTNTFLTSFMRILSNIGG